MISVILEVKGGGRWQNLGANFWGQFSKARSLGRLRSMFGIPATKVIATAHSVPSSIKASHLQIEVINATEFIT